MYQIIFILKKFDRKCGKETSWRNPKIQDTIAYKKLMQHKYPIPGGILSRRHFLHVAHRTTADGAGEKQNKKHSPTWVIHNHRACPHVPRPPLRTGLHWDTGRAHTTTDHQAQHTKINSTTVRGERWSRTKKVG